MEGLPPSPGRSLGKTGFTAFDLRLRFPAVSAVHFYPQRRQKSACAGQRAHLAPQRIRKSGWKVWQGSQATTHCHSACGPDLNTSVAQPPATGCAARYDTYSPAMNANAMNWICTCAGHLPQHMSGPRSCCLSLQAMAGCYPHEVVSNTQVGRRRPGQQYPRATQLDTHYSACEDAGTQEGSWRLVTAPESCRAAMHDMHIKAPV